MFPSRQLRGHTGPVTCLKGSSNTLDKKLLASGSEDKTVRLWDCNEQKAVKCLHKCFPSDIEAMEFHPLKSHLLYVGSGNMLYSFDLRNGSILQSIPFGTADGFEDINSLSMNNSGTQLAIADDSSLVYLMRINEDGSFQPMGKQPRALQRVHENMVGTIAFANINKKNHIYTGGYDYICCCWDVERCRPIKSADISTLEENKTNDNNFFNPPFINHLRVLEEKHLIALALGDGSLRLLRANGLNTIYANTVHAGPITAMHTIDSEYLISGSIDSTIRGWQVQYEHHPDLAGSMTSKKKREKVIAEAPVMLQPLWTIQHSSKINSLYADVETSIVTSTPTIAVESVFTTTTTSTSTSACDATAIEDENDESTKEMTTSTPEMSTTAAAVTGNMMHVYTGDTTNMITHYYIR